MGVFSIEVALAGQMERIWVWTRCSQGSLHKGHPGGVGSQSNLHWGCPSKPAGAEVNLECSRVLCTCVTLARQLEL